MNTLGAAGGVGLILGGIDFNKTNTTALQIGNSSTSVNGIVQLNGATINGTPGTFIRVAGSADLTIANVNTGTNTQTMGLRLGATSGLMDVSTSRTLTLAVAISQATADSGFTKTGAGTLVLSGAQNNTYSGTTAVNDGTLDLNKTANIDAIAGNLTVGDNIGAAQSAVTRLLASNQIKDASTVTINSDGKLDIAGNSDTVGSVILAGGNISGTTGTLTGSSYDVRSGSVSAILSGAGGLTKTTAGTVTLTAANTYGGGTTITAGTLQVSNTSGSATGSGSVAFNNAADTVAILASGAGTTGAISGLVTTANTNSTFNPGGTGTIGTMTLSGGLNATNGATFLFDIGGSSDLITLGGAAFMAPRPVPGPVEGTPGGLLNISFTQLSGAAPNTPYTLFTFGSASGLDAGDFSVINSPGFEGATFMVNPDSVMVTFSAVPEPSTYAAGILAVLAVGWTQRKRLSSLRKRCA
jgi:autotransporter-associated beta strand protein